MTATEATVHAVKVAEAAGFRNPAPTVGELVKGRTPRNWWRELVSETWSDANAVWEQEAEAATLGYATEMSEWLETHPRPTLKSVMVGLKGAM
jgi:hypothetical protein